MSVDPNKREERPKLVDFEKNLADLESIVGRLEAGELPLARSLEEFERGIASLRACYSLLSEAERRIELLSGVDANGRPQTEPFDAEKSFDPESSSPTAGRAKKRRAVKEAEQGPLGGDVDDEGRLF